ncbi:S8 family serine peptidase [Lysobacter capsici]|uniref:S8 family peptidase n=1 Tax=Lysobacter capsici TaxID=435897 RepID=UPI001780CC63|nr:S8 family serine peptidase [Lysobacter capsici]UOF13709.1 S8 family serine peptidase [Lysobacter capsici]
MSARSNSFNLLAAATALAIAAASGSAFAADRVDLSSLNVDGSQQFGRFLVKYRSGSAPRGDVASFNKAIANAASATSSRLGGGKRAVQLKRLRRTASGADVVISSRALSRDEAATLMRQLAADQSVESVSNDILMVPYFTPNDTNFSQQFGFGTGTGGIRATTAWDVTKGEGTVVAVIDTGITNHSDLNANVIAGYDMISGDDPADGLPGSGFFIANDGDGRDANPADPGDWIDSTDTANPTVQQFCGMSNSSWHGSHVAGTVAAVTNNAKGVAGTAHNAKILPVRVLGKCGGYGSDIADAITWASGGSVPGVPANPNPADVINLSLGSRAPVACSQITKDAFNGAVARGSIVVVAAGNSNGDALLATNTQGEAVGYTNTNCGTVISVGSTTSSGARSSFSNYGTGVDIAAPGSGILSTVNNGTKGPTTETYKSYDGTSMAAPHVAGVAALVQSVAPTPLTQEQMRTLLKNTARAFPVSPGTKPIGAGIVNAAAAVAAVQGTNPGAQTYSNGTDANIPDNNATGVSTSITVSGRTGNAPSNAQVAVSIVHTYQGDLIVDLIAPDGSVYNLHSRTGAGTDNINQTYTVNLSSEALNGTWKLRAADRDAQDTGRIDSWSVTF